MILCNKTRMSISAAFLSCWCRNFYHPNNKKTRFTPNIPNLLAQCSLKAQANEAVKWRQINM